MGSQRETLCVISHHLYNPKIYDSCYIAVCFALPLTIIGVLYTRICLHLWRSSEHTARLSSGNFTPTPASSLPIAGQSSLTSGQRTSSAPRIFENNNEIVIDDRRKLSPQMVIEVKTTNELGVGTKSAVTKLSSGGQVERILAQRRQVIKLMISLVLSFALLSAPFHIRKLAQHFYPAYDVASNAATIATLATTLLLYFNSAMNPLLYLCFSSRIRSLMKRVLTNPCLICSRGLNLSQSNTAYNNDNSFYSRSRNDTQLRSFMRVPDGVRVGSGSAISSPAVPTANVIVVDNNHSVSDDNDDDNGEEIVATVTSHMNHNNNNHLDYNHQRTTSGAVPEDCPSANVQSIND